MNGYNKWANHNDVYFLTILATILVQYRSHLTILAAWWQLVVLCDSWQGGNSVEPLKQVQLYKVRIHWDFEMNLFSPSWVRFTSTQLYMITKKNITGNPHSLHDTSWSLCLMDLDDWTSVLDLSKIFHYLAFRSLPDFYGVCPCRGMAGRRLLFGTRCPKLGTKGSWFPIVVGSRADPSPPGWNSCRPAHHPNFITVIPKYCSGAQLS